MAQAGDARNKRDIVANRNQIVAQHQGGCSLNDTSHIVCGIDPGLHQTGYGVLRFGDRDDRIELLDAGVIRCARQGPIAPRLVELADGIEEVFDEYGVEIVAVEKVYSHYQHPQTAVLMAHARGVMLLAAARRDLDVIDIPSTSVKRHLTGNGRASKLQIQRAVAAMLSLAKPPEPPDVADAIAIAMCAAGVCRRAHNEALHESSTTTARLSARAQR
jgi:crossover junction endodeoxyribonuclease RuvC